MLFPSKRKNRRERIKRLQHVLDNRAKNEKPSQVVANFCIVEEVTTRKVREYIKLLFLLEKISEADFEEIESKVTMG